METGQSIQWRSWSTEAFTAAHRGARPVLLTIVTSWSAACRRAEDRVLLDPSVIDLIEERYVAVRVDADRRPDIADRYTLGGWPTIAMLTPDGELLSGGMAADASRLARALVEVSDAFTTRRPDIDARARAARRSRRDDARAAAGVPPALDPAIAEWVATHLSEAFDRTWGGFGQGAKTPLAAPVAFSLAQGARTGDSDLTELAIRTLDRIGWSELSDAADGAFNRACFTRDWTEPDTARLLEVQADLTALFLEASVFLGQDAYAARARAALDYVLERLADTEGGFFNSQAERIVEQAAPIDRVLVTSANARMVRTLLRAAEVLDEPRFAERAAATIERLVPIVYAAGAGLAHYLDDQPRVRGLLVDQVDMSAALIDLTQASGNRVYLELAEELMRSCLRKLWRVDGGGFLDRLPGTSGGNDIGRMADPLVPLGVNCDAARVLARLAREIGDAALGARAHDVLAALTPVYRAHGVLAADYALALAEVQGRLGM